MTTFPTRQIANADLETAGIDNPAAGNGDGVARAASIAAQTTANSAGTAAAAAAAQATAITASLSNPSPGYGDTVARSQVQANTIVEIGDSRTTRDSIINATTGNSYNYGLMTWFNILSGHKYRLLNNAGVDGQTSTQILARFSTDVAPYLPTGVLIEAGINDIIQQVPEDTTKANLYNLCKSCLQIGAIPMIRTVTAWDANLLAVLGVTLPSASARVQLENVNDYIRKLPASLPGVVVADVAKALASPFSATGYAAANMLADGLHQTTLGAQTAGAVMKAAWDSLFQASDTGLFSVIDNYAYSVTSKNILDGGMLSLTDGSGSAAGAGTNGTGSSGTVATGFTVSATIGSPTVVCSLVARADGLGYDQQMVVTFGAAGDTIRMRKTSMGARANLGDYVSSACDVAVSSPVALRGAYLQAETQTVAGQRLAGDGAPPVGAVGTPLQNLLAFTGRHKTMPSQIDPAGTSITNIACNYFIVGNGAGSVTVKVGRFEMRKGLTALSV